VLPTIRGSPSYPGTGRLLVPMGWRWECGLSMEKAVLKGLEQCEHPPLTWPQTCASSQHQSWGAEVAVASAGLLRAGIGERWGWLHGRPVVWVVAQRGAGGACHRPGAGQAPSHSLTLSLFPLCASLPVGLLHTSFSTYFLVGLSGAFLGNPFYCKMNKRLQNNRRLHWPEWACNHNHAAALPPPPGPREVGRERRCGRKTLGQLCWAGRKARCVPWPRAPVTEEWSQPAWEKPLAQQAAPPCTADLLQVH